MKTRSQFQILIKHFTASLFKVHKKKSRIIYLAAFIKIEEFLTVPMCTYLYFSINF